MMAKRGVRLGAYDIAAVDVALSARIRKTMEAIRASIRLFLAHGRNLYQVNGEWVCVYRAVDKHGRTVDHRLSKHRDIETANQFFRQALGNNRPPRIVTLDA
jgi:putative transposase